MTETELPCNETKFSSLSFQRESRATHGQLKGGKGGKGVLSCLILRDNEGRHIYVPSLSPLKCSFVFMLLKLLPRQSVTSMFVVLIISNMQVATLPHGFGVRDLSGGLKLLLFVKLFDTTESLKSNVSRPTSSPARSPANS